MDSDKKETVSQAATSRSEQSTSSMSVSRLQINDSKAGMENIDKEKINAIILKHSQNSKFFLKQQKRETELRKRAEEKFQSLSAKCTQKDLENAQKQADEYLNELEKRRDFTRQIVHIDMDAFYASVEMRDNPSLADKPMAVGSDSMLSTSNYVARRYGVRAAMPGFIAKELCPDLIIVPCNFRKYQHESQMIMKVISEYDANYSAMSLDEAYLDITEHLLVRTYSSDAERTFPKFYKPLGEQQNKDQTMKTECDTVTFGTDTNSCVNEIRHRIYLATNLTASAGIACNLRLAKLCSDVNKPNGQFRLESDTKSILDFVEPLPIRKMNGIGPSTALILDCYGIKTCKDIYEKRGALFLLETQNSFEFLMNVCRGLGTNRISHEHEKKSLGHETTFPAKFANNKDELLKMCLDLSEEVSEELKGDQLEAQKVHIKIKTTNFEIYTRTKSIGFYTNQTEAIYEAAKTLFLNEWQTSKGKLRLRLIGVRVSDLRDVQMQHTHGQMSKSNSVSSQLKTLDNYFDKSNLRKDKKSTEQEIVKEEEEEEEKKLDDSADFLKFSSFSCPHCECDFYSNDEFFFQHIDSCFLFH